MICSICKKEVLVNAWGDQKCGCTFLIFDGEQE